LFITESSSAEISARSSREDLCIRLNFRQHPLRQQLHNKKKRRHRKNGDAFLFSELFFLLLLLLALVCVIVLLILAAGTILCIAGEIVLVVSVIHFNHLSE
jgi:Flp pilus assembly protein TadB